MKRSVENLHPSGRGLFDVGVGFVGERSFIFLCLKQAATSEVLNERMGTQAGIKLATHKLMRLPVFSGQQGIRNEVVALVFLCPKKLIGVRV